MQDKTPLIIGFDGTTLDKSLANHLLEMNPAGILLFKRNIISLDQTRKLITEIKALLGDIIISIDHEGGIVSRFPENVPISPSPRALFRNGSREVLDSACQIQASPLAQLGINLNFAPVVDLYGNKDSRVIGIRAFSENPEEVKIYAEACIKAHNIFHIGTTAKHFPGHGSTETDTHFDTGKINLSKKELLQKDLLPFIYSIKMDVPAIMTAHLNYPSFDKEYPASISKRIISDLLRESLSFKGLIITDCIEMAGLSKTYSPEEIIEKGLDAGVDLWISSFSFNKDRSFQLDLKKKLAQLKISKAYQSRYCETQVRVQCFLSQYKVKPVGTQDFLTDAIKLSKKCIFKKNNFKGNRTFTKLHLIEITSQDYSGLNSQLELGGTASIIEKECCEHIVSCSVISPNQSAELEEILKKVKKENEGILLLTRNSFRHPNHLNLIDEITRNKSCFQIALLNEEDLTGKAEIEWSVLGSNSTMAIALAEEINEMLEDGFKTN